jgi:hypothetical protein
MDQAVRDAENERKGNIPIVAHKRSDCEWLVTMQADDWFTILREWESGMVLDNTEDSKNEGQ